MSEEGGGIRIEENIHSIIFAVVYGLLLIVIIVHLVIHWHLRRRKLRAHALTIPGGKSFKNKKFRQIVSNDFQHIQSLTSDFRLIDHTLSPSSFGGQAGGVPSHWYRMKGFDAAADFVSTHVNMIDKDESDRVHHIYLPEFLALIKEKGIVDSSCDDTISQINSLYNHLRHELEDFELVHYQQLTNLLESLANFFPSHLSSHLVASLTPLATPTTPRATPTTLWHERVSAKTSSEFLITKPQSIAKTTLSAGASNTATAHPSGIRRDSKGHRPVNLELTPLVGRDTSSPSPGYSIASHSHVPIPGTPV